MLRFIDMLFMKVSTQARIKAYYIWYKKHNKPIEPLMSSLYFKIFGFNFLTVNKTEEQIVNFLGKFYVGSNGYVKVKRLHGILYARLIFPATAADKQKVRWLIIKEAKYFI
jgi:hypothetical protein